MSNSNSIRLSIVGMGLIFYSPFAASEIKEGEDYFLSSFENPENVKEQALRGGIVGVNLGTPGDFILEMHFGYPSEEMVKNSRYKLRAGIEVRDELICVRDLFDLMSWSKNVPDNQIIRLDSGFYHMTFLSDDPPSGVLGDNQFISLYLQKLDEMPKLKFSGVPTLC